jgi:phage baseplate assembly protein W
VPLDNISRQFKDISLSFLKHPVTKDIGILRNEDAVKKSVTNLVRTRIGERFFNPLLGSNVESYLFSLAESGLQDSLEEEIKTVLKNFEPRISLKTVSAFSIPDQNEIQVNIVYDIVGLDLTAQSITFILQPTRY